MAHEERSIGVNCLVSFVVSAAATLALLALTPVRPVSFELYVGSRKGLPCGLLPSVCSGTDPSPAATQDNADDGGQCWPGA
jgi:hypothetical protein